MSMKPKLETELDILEQLESGSVTSQLSLSKRISVSVGFVNALLNRAIQKGFVKVSTAPRKRYAYYVTPQGFREKSRLVAEYLETSLQFFRKARAEYRTLFEEAIPSSAGKYILAGSGELAEIALLAANETGREVDGIFDPAAGSEKLLGLTVYRELDLLDQTAVLVVTEKSQPQALYEQLRLRFPYNQILAPKFLRVVGNSLATHDNVDAAE
ncbi:MAG: winged helix-turn-helix transcriptional regulator [Pseudomonadota bacterium]